MKRNSLYFHFPFCLRKCGYCDFYSLPFRQELAWPYVEAMCREVSLYAGSVKGRCDTVYLGGGTPSLMSPEQVRALLEAVEKHIGIEEGAEITLEANPGTIDLPKVKGFKESGVNRISLGAQSFSDRELKILGRIHGVAEIIESIGFIRKGGITNLNLDLIFGIPGQKLSDWKRNLKKLSDLKPEHASLYLLQLEEEVPLAFKLRNKELVSCSEDEEACMYYTAVEELTDDGYQHYEISNFARAGLACRHNMNYWLGNDYIGIGAGAVSFRCGVRYRNLPDVTSYLQRLAAGEPPLREVMERLSEDERAAEAMILGLRLIAGVDMQVFAARHRVDPRTRWKREIEWAVDKGLIIRDKDTLKLTKKGLFLSNEVFALFV